MEEGRSAFKILIGKSTERDRWGGLGVDGGDNIRTDREEIGINAVN